MSRVDIEAIIADHKRSVDRTLIRENLRRTHHERLVGLQKLQRFAGELRVAGERVRKSGEVDEHSS